MAEDQTTQSGNQQGGQGGQQGVQVLLDEREMRTMFVNAYRFHTMVPPAEEPLVILDLGFNMANPNPNPQMGQQQQMLFKVGDRVIMSWLNAKRLANALTQLVYRYEQQFGEIPLQPAARK
jgi:hypothetical protein